MDTEVPVPGISLAVQWLELCTSTAGGTGLIPGRGTKILQAAWPKKTPKKYQFLRVYVQICPTAAF